jgi:hypothetical protein
MMVEDGRRGLGEARGKKSEKPGGMEALTKN